MNEIKYNNNLLSKIFLYTYFIVFITILFVRDSNIIMVLSSGIINHIYYAALLLGTVVNLFIMIYSDINLNTSIYNLVISLLFIISFFIPILFSKKLLPLVFVFFVVSALNSRLVTPNKFIKTDFYMRLSLIVITVALMLVKIIPSYVTMRGSNSRYSFGFSGPNSCAVIVLSIFLSYSLIYHKKNKHIIIPLIVLIIIYTFVYMFTNTRQLFILGLLFICCYYLNNNNYLKKFMDIISNVLIIIVMAFSVIISVAFVYDPDINNPFFYWLNSISSSRLLIESRAFLDYPVELLGNTNMPLIGLKGENIDNLFASDLLHCGLLGLGLIILTILWYVIKSIKYGNRFTNISIIIILLAFLTIYTDELYAPLIYVASLAYYKERNRKYYAKKASK